jgi:hypothetical protein
VTSTREGASLGARPNASELRILVSNLQIATASPSVVDRHLQELCGYDALLRARAHFVAHNVLYVLRRGAAGEGASRGSERR